jgi:hypothetical protein
MMETPYIYLRDIRGLDPVGWWPPAIGWWLLAGLVLLLFALLILLWRSRYLFASYWRWDAVRQLKTLRHRCTREDSKEIGRELSELLRRIAIARHGREACAGLTGDDWLERLNRDDPTGFDWKSHGRILLTLPYSPPGPDEGREELKGLISAALRAVTVGAKKDGYESWQPRWMPSLVRRRS